eukprot:8428302-Ditylum_brightwellii.AAC.1
MRSLRTVDQYEHQFSDWEDVSLLVPSLEKADVELVDGGFDVCSFRTQGEDPMNLTIYDASQYAWWVCRVGRDI